MRFLEGALGSNEESTVPWLQTDGSQHAHVGFEGADLTAWQAARHSRASSFIRRCWYQERGCDESSTCTDLRNLWEGIRKDVTKLPTDKECGRPLYIVTGSSLVHRNGTMDENRLETLVFPGEKWHKCCVIPGEDGTKPQFTCEHLKEVPRQKLFREMKGWCGPHKCIGPKQRCLVVDEEKIDGFKPKHKGECPLQCKTECNKVSQKFECIDTGDEPPYGREGSEVTKKAFGEAIPYDVYALSTDDTMDKSETPALPETEAAQSCMPLVAALLPPPPLVAGASRSGTRQQRWSSFLS